MLKGAWIPAALTALALTVAGVGPVRAQAPAGADAFAKGAVFFQSDSTASHEAACAHLPVPPDGPWTLTYSFGGGKGAASAYLSLSSNGNVVLISGPAGSTPTTKHMTVSAETVAKIAHAVDTSRLDCIRTVPRKGYIVVYMGSYDLGFESGGKTASATVDACHAVDDGRAFGALVRTIHELSPLLGDGIKAGPEKPERVAGTACDGATSTPVIITHGGEPPSGGDTSPERNASLDKNPVRPPSAAIVDFLAKVETADAIADPLKRCLAFPDLPGNRWAPGLAEAECHATFDPRRMSLKLMELRLAGKEPASLDRIFAEDLARHFSTTDFSEVIDRDFDVIDASDRADEVTRNWLRQDPHSAFALAARGAYFSSLAWHSRGSRWASDTPKNHLRAMSASFAKAIPLFQQALKIEPHLMPAYAELVAIGNADSRAELRRQAFEAGRRIDPGCSALDAQEMSAREPRWGGSYRQMEALQDDLRPLVARRPLLAVQLAAAETDRGSMLCAEKRYAEATRKLGTIPMLAVGSPAYACLSWSMAMQRENPYRWDDLAALIEATRYKPDDKDANARLGFMLMEAQRPDLALRYTQRASAAAPGDGELHEQMANLEMLNNDPQAREAELRRGLADPITRQHDTLELIRLLVDRRAYADAREQVDAFNREFPNDPDGWESRYVVYRSLGDTHEAIVSLETYLAKATGKDPATVGRVKYFSKILESMKTQPASPPASH